VRPYSRRWLGHVGVVLGRHERLELGLFVVDLGADLAEPCWRTPTPSGRSFMFWTLLSKRDTALQSGIVVALERVAVSAPGIEDAGGFLRIDVGPDERLGLAVGDGVADDEPLGRAPGLGPRSSRGWGHRDRASRVSVVGDQLDAVAIVGQLGADGGPGRCGVGRDELTQLADRLDPRRIHAERDRLVRLTVLAGNEL